MHENHAINGLFVVALLSLTGCLEPARLNARCEWVGDSNSGPVDMRSARDRSHLANDVRVAGENAVRYGDSAMVHVGVERSVVIRFECRDRLHAAIIANHGVSDADIEEAARMRNFWIDAASVYIPMGVVFFLVATRLSRRMFRRLPAPGEQWTLVVKSVWTGLTASGVATAVAYLFSWQVDSVILRNFHMSFRVGYLPLGRHPWLAYFVALLIFALACQREFRRARARPAGSVRRRPFD